MKKVAIVYHYLAHYRLPIFQQMMLSKHINYTIYSGISSDVNISKIDVKILKDSISNGGLRWSPLKNKWLLKRRFLWQRGIIRTVLKDDFQAYIFLGSPYHLTTWIAGILARIRGRKVYFWMHGFYKDKATSIDNIKLFAFYKIANGFFLYGKRAANILADRKIIKKEKIHIVYNSLDYNKSLMYRKEISPLEISEFRKSYFSNTSLPIVVFIGRLTSVKRIDYLIKSMVLAKEIYGKSIFNLIIIGDGDEEGSLKKMARLYKLENNINFLGAIYEEKVNAEILSYSDLCVTPGEIGLTAIHSLSYGTPVISHDNFNIQMPEVEAIKRGINGDLYKYNDIHDLCTVIKTWFENNPRKTKEISNRCYEIVDNLYNPFYQSKVFDSVFLNES